MGKLVRIQERGDIRISYVLDLRDDYDTNFRVAEGVVRLERENASMDELFEVGELDKGESFLFFIVEDVFIDWSRRAYSLRLKYYGSYQIGVSDELIEKDVLDKVLRYFVFQF